MAVESNGWGKIGTTESGGEIFQGKSKGETVYMVRTPVQGQPGKYQYNWADQSGNPTGESFYGYVNDNVKGSIARDFKGMFGYGAKSTNMTTDENGFIVTSNDQADTRFTNGQVRPHGANDFPANTGSGYTSPVAGEGVVMSLYSKGNGANILYTVNGHDIIVAVNHLKPNLKVGQKVGGNTQLGTVMDGHTDFKVYNLTDPSDAELIRSNAEKGIPMGRDAIKGKELLNMNADYYMSTEKNDALADNKPTYFTGPNGNNYVVANGKNYYNNNLEDGFEFQVINGEVHVVNTGDATQTGQAPSYYKFDADTVDYIDTTTDKYQEYKRLQKEDDARYNNSIVQGVTNETTGMFDSKKKSYEKSKELSDIENTRSKYTTHPVKRQEGDLYEGNINDVYDSEIKKLQTKYNIKGKPSEEEWAKYSYEMQSLNDTFKYQVDQMIEIANSSETSKDVKEEITKSAKDLVKDQYELSRDNWNQNESKYQRRLLKDLNRKKNSIQQSVQDGSMSRSDADKELALINKAIQETDVLVKSNDVLYASPNEKDISNKHYNPDLSQSIANAYAEGQSLSIDSDYNIYDVLAGPFLPIKALADVVGAEKIPDGVSDWWNNNPNAAVEQFSAIQEYLQLYGDQAANGLHLRLPGEDSIGGVNPYAGNPIDKVGAGTGGAGTGGSRGQSYGQSQGSSQSGNTYQPIRVAQKGQEKTIDKKLFEKGDIVDMDDQSSTEYTVRSGKTIDELNKEIEDLQSSLAPEPETNKRNIPDLGNFSDIAQVVGGLAGMEDLPKYETSAAFNKYQAMADQLSDMGLTEQELAEATQELRRAYIGDVENIKRMSGGSGGTALANLNAASDRYYSGLGRLSAEDRATRRANRSEFYQAATAAERVNRVQFEDDLKEVMDINQGASNLLSAGLFNMDERNQYNKTYGPGSAHSRYMNALAEQEELNAEALKASYRKNREENLANKIAERDNLISNRNNAKVEKFKEDNRQLSDFEMIGEINNLNSTIDFSPKGKVDESSILNNDEYDYLYSM